MGLFLVVELECSSLLAWAVVATCSRCSIFLMLHNTRTRYTLHNLICDSVPELVVTSLYVHDGVNIFQILHGSPGHLWEHKHSVCFTQIWRPDPPPPSPHRTRSLETRARGTEWFYCKEDLNIEGNFTIFFLNTEIVLSSIVMASHKSYWPRLAKTMSVACLWRWGAIGREGRPDLCGQSFVGQYKVFIEA